jgi:hypothetical protein
MKMDVVERARKYVNSMPDSVEGSGGNGAMFAVVSALVNGFGLGDADAWAILREWNSAKAHPAWSEKELERMLASAKEKGSEKGVGHLLKGQNYVPVGDDGVKRAPKRRPEGIPPYDEGLLMKVARAAPPAAGMEGFFMDRSPVDPRSVTPAQYLDAVFDEGDRVLVFENFYSQGDFLHVAGKAGGKSYALSQDRGVKAVGSDLPKRGAEGVWYLNQPVTGLWCANSKGEYSRRIGDCVAAWRHVVLESDCAPTEWWLRFLAVFPGHVKAIYSSGGRSWHALVATPYATKEAMDAELTKVTKRTLPRLGADAGALTSMRLTRLPGCKRGMREQRLIFLNPSPDGREILTMPPLRKV